jgi:hypothetical protein
MASEIAERLNGDSRRHAQRGRDEGSDWFVQGPDPEGVRQPRSDRTLGIGPSPTPLPIQLPIHVDHVGDQS